MTTEIDTLKAALEACEALDPIVIVKEFRAFEHSCAPGTYCALVLDPHDGSTHTVNEASWSCSTDEYFAESGVLSRTTLLSATRAHWSPSPDDGFEWCDGEDYVHPEGDPAGWITADAFAELDKEDRAQYTEWFSISSDPVDGWVPEGGDDWTVREVRERIARLCNAICDEIEKQES